MDKNTFDVLVKDYVKTIPDKVKLLEELIESVKITKSIEDIKELRLEIHKMAGSAGTYGFNAVSALCKEEETKLISIIEEFDPSRLDAEFFSLLVEFIKNIQIEFNNGTQT